MEHLRGRMGLARNTRTCAGRIHACGRFMHAVGALVCVALAVFALPAAGQGEPQQLVPDYAINTIRAAPPVVPEQFAVAFEVINTGVPASGSSTATLSLGETVLVTQPIAAVGANSQITVTLVFPRAALAEVPDLTRLTATVGVPDIEVPGSPSVENNTAFISVIEVRSAWEARFGAETGEATPGTVTDTPTEGELLGPSLDVFGTRIVIPQVVLGLLEQPQTVLIGIVAVGVGLVVIWLITVIVRVLFSRPPVFPVWQPTYVQNPHLPPESPQARRQMWQHHASSDTLPMPNAGVAYAARKLLLGSDGAKLGRWEIVGVRLVQYDMYGRVQRTNTIAPRKVGQGLAKLARANTNPRRPLTREAAVRRVRPLVKAALREFLPRLKNSAALPIAVDVRFRGQRGEVRILFELYASDGRAWALLDAWEPELILMAGALLENFTYTLFGQGPNEKGREFRRRLETELTGLLAAMVEAPPAVQEAALAARARPRKAPAPTQAVPRPAAQAGVSPVAAGAPQAFEQVSPATASMPPISEQAARQGPQAQPVMSDTQQIAAARPADDANT
jgi:hypothetical protein